MTPFWEWATERWVWLLLAYLSYSALFLWLATGLCRGNGSHDRGRRR